MRVVINETQVNRNRRISHILFFVSLAGMGLGFFYTWTSDPSGQTSQISCLVLPLLLVLTLTSVRMANTWIREPRPEGALADGLKGLGKKYTLFHYLLPAPHVLIAPEGVFSITTLWQERTYRVEGQKWHGDEGLLRKLNGYMRQDLIGSPFQTALYDAQRLQKLIDKISPDSGVEVQPLIVFINPKGSFESEDPLFPVLYADSRRKPSLRLYLRDQVVGERATLGEETLDKIDSMYGLLTRHDIADLMGETADYGSDDEGDFEADLADEPDQARPAPRKAAGAATGSIFVAQSGQLFYIGATEDLVEDALADLNAEQSVEASLVHSFETDDLQSTLATLHRKYDRKRQRESWFGLSKKDLAWLKSRKGSSN